MPCRTLRAMCLRVKPWCMCWSMMRTLAFVPALLLPRRKPEPIPDAAEPLPLGEPVG